MPLVTICILTYNPDWIKFRSTLRSIICQRNVDFDIVVSDDGSEENYFDKAEEFLKENNFSDYRFIANKQNQGTVKNTISALQNVESKYVKLISPGDFLYNENVLSEFVDFAEKNPAVAYFGNAVYYSVDEKKGIIIYDGKHNPIDLKPWINKDYRKIRKKYLYDIDYILGAAFLCNRVMFSDYLHRIDGAIKYLEDFSMTWMIIARKKILYFDEVFIFYEYGSGVSTSTATWVKRLKEDIMKGCDLVYRNHDMSYFEYILCKSTNPYVRLLFRLILDPLCFLDRFKKTEVIKNDMEKNQREFIQTLRRILN